MKNSTQKYQGFANYPTWLLTKHISQDIHLQQHLSLIIQEAKKYHTDSPLEYIEQQLEQLFGSAYVWVGEDPTVYNPFDDFHTELLEWALDQLDFGNLARHYFKD